MRVTKKVSGAKRIHRRERVRTILAIEDFKSPNEKLEDEDLTSEELLLEDPGRSDPGLGWPALCLHSTTSTSTSTSAASTCALELAPPQLVPAQLGLVRLSQLDREPTVDGLGALVAGGVGALVGADVIRHGKDWIDRLHQAEE